MRLRFVLPIVYSVAAFVLVVGFGGAGHGKGIEVFYYLSLPSGAISIVVERSLRSGEFAMISCFLAGLIQYFLVGYLLDLWRGRKRDGDLRSKSRMHENGSAP